MGLGIVSGAEGIFWKAQVLWAKGFKQEGQDCVRRTRSLEFHAGAWPHHVSNPLLLAVSSLRFPFIPGNLAIFTQDKNQPFNPFQIATRWIPGQLPLALQVWGWVYGSSQQEWSPGRPSPVRKLPADILQYEQVVSFWDWSSASQDLFWWASAVLLLCSALKESIVVSLHQSLCWQLQHRHRCFRKSQDFILLSPGRCSDPSNIQ